MEGGPLRLPKIINVHDVGFLHPTSPLVNPAPIQTLLSHPNPLNCLTYQLCSHSNHSMQLPSHLNLLACLTYQLYSHSNHLTKTQLPLLTQNHNQLHPVGKRQRVPGNDRQAPHWQQYSLDKSVEELHQENHSFVILLNLLN